MEVELIVLKDIEDLSSRERLSYQQHVRISRRLRTLWIASYFFNALAKSPFRNCASPSSVRYTSDCMSSRSCDGLGASFCP